MRFCASQWGFLISLYETSTLIPASLLYPTLAKWAIRESLGLPKRHTKTPPLIVRAASYVSFHICNEDFWDKMARL